MYLSIICQRLLLQIQLVSIRSSVSQKGWIESESDSPICGSISWTDLLGDQSKLRPLSFSKQPTQRRIFRSSFKPQIHICHQHLWNKFPLNYLLLLHPAFKIPSIIVVSTFTWEPLIRTKEVQKFSLPQLISTVDISAHYVQVSGDLLA